MDKTLVDDFPASQRGDLKTRCLFSGAQFKYPVGVVLSISGGGAVFGRLPEMRQGLGRERWRRGVEVELPPEHSRLWV